MPTFTITAPDGHEYDIDAPEGATEQQVLEYAQQNIKLDPYGLTAQNRSPVDNFIAATGGSMKGLYLGGKQALGLADQKEVDAHLKAMEGLNTTKSGKAGAFTGLVAPAIATAAVPGANTYTGAALTGALFGASQPTAEGESRALNAAMGTAGGIGGKYFGDKAANWAISKYNASKAAKATEKAKNTVRDATLKETQAAGYNQPPSVTGKASPLEMVSGKYKTQQALGIDNQKVTDRLAREAIGLDETAELSAAKLQNMRTQAFNQGYEPIRSSGSIKVDNQYLDDLTKIVSKYDKAKKSFPNAKTGDVQGVVDDIMVDTFDAGDAVDMIAIYREQADKAFASGDKALGHAYKSAANAIEDQIQRFLPDGELLNNFKQARQFMAKTHTVEKALKESTGQVDATKIGREFEKGKPLTGGLKTVGKQGSAFPKVSRIPEDGHPNPFTIVDLMQASAVSPLGYIASGNPVGMAAGMALPLARVAARETLRHTRPKIPSYAPSAIEAGLKSLLGNDTAKALIQGAGIGGLLYQ